jgi:hypothetical protein
LSRKKSELAEALIIRADLQTKFEQLKQRLMLNAKVQEGDKPAEDPAKLLREIEDVSAELLRLIQRINATNSTTQLVKGMTIADAIACRDVLRMKQSMFRELAAAAAVKQDRFTKSEVKFASTVDIARLQKQADALAKEHRELDTKIQEANWLTDLKE